MRERLDENNSSLIPLRITPARAGKTNIWDSRLADSWDHPRSCGKDVKISSSGLKERGSPPLVRERLNDNEEWLSYHGITPARAGKTCVLIQDARSFWDHPRSCGKDLSSIHMTIPTTGSPPLVRERPDCILAARDSLGITPARAGKTVMDSFICAISLLPVFKIYLISFQSISTLQLLRNLGGC